MRHTTLSALILAGLLGVAIAQEPPPPPPEPPLPPVRLREVVAAESPPSKRLYFVVDVSGSIATHGLAGRMFRAVRTGLAQPFDDYEAALVTFDATADQWPGFVEKDDPSPAPPGWAKLPSENAAAAASAWLANVGVGGDTQPCSALEIALMSPRRDLTVIFVTDGGFDGDAAIATIRECQAMREKNGLGRALIIVYGLGTTSADQPHLHEIATEGGGGFYVEDAPNVQAILRACSQLHGIAPVQTPNVPKFSPR